MRVGPRMRPQMNHSGLSIFYQIKCKQNSPRHSQSFHEVCELLCFFSASMSVLVFPPKAAQVLPFCTSGLGTGPAGVGLSADQGPGTGAVCPLTGDQEQELQGSASPPTGDQEQEALASLATLEPEKELETSASQPTLEPEQEQEVLASPPTLEREQEQAVSALRLTLGQEQEVLASPLTLGQEQEALASLPILGQEQEVLTSPLTLGQEQEQDASPPILELMGAWRPDQVWRTELRPPPASVLSGYGDSEPRLPPPSALCSRPTELADA
ncbi:involucrin-like isoform X1 [Paralichthys olivaceus]|uniref:involucrin-like isoform X1 n=1 Tax=Paralichthys olivaceus TaxID=8255 RepID=UPI003751BFF4